MKKIISVSVFLLVSAFLFAQQDALYSQYMFNMMAVNPAYAGSREVLSITGLSRAQWLGIEGAPVSNTLSFDMPVKRKRIGLGILVFNDKIGITSSSGLYTSYAYRIPFERSTLSFGLQVGLIHFTSNYAQLRLSSTPVTTPDNAFQENANILLPSIGAGIYLSDDRYYIGASLPGFLNTQLSSGAQVPINKYDHLFLMGGYVFKLNKDFKLKPSVLLKAVKSAPMQVDLNLTFWMYDLLAIGTSFRTDDAAVGIIELQAARNFRIGYAYDYSFGTLRYFNSGSHELMLRYEFGYTKDKILTPRYF